ncbi:MULTISPECIES: peptidoglycan DD-metalloendopeptidase family protein [unclassified Pseudoxanthomonas]|uniref:peptidoglycan DD-metalloendopeptidase family protein n=1 Tax=unclassified Pseudoxanthomonas TaxID=2645906 RepID=UPI0030789F10
MQSHGDGDRRKQRFQERLEVLRDTTLHQRMKRHLPAGRWTRRHWIHASLFTTIGILVATIVPGFSNAIQVPMSEPRATLTLQLPELPSEELAGTDGDSWQMVKVKPGQTLGAIFEELGIPATTMHLILKNADAKAALTRLKPGTEIGFDLPVTGTLRTLRYDRGPAHRVELSLVGDTVREKVIARETATRTVVLSGKVGRSLNRSARNAGLTAANIRSLTDDIFKYDIDFNSDLGADDRFSVVVEQTWREGELVETSPVLAATFTVKGKLHSGFRYARTGGKPEYFTAEGRPLKKSFIRMPIQYARLSSKFGARRHPVLGTMRMHKGVDYAASTGTPIMAAGDARVQFAGWQGGYGRTVILDHGRGHTTLYGHMSRLGNIKQGQRVAQGTVIGYVGTTGLSTGPHLHYEFRVNGVHRNPLSVTMPPPEPLSGAQLASFRTQTANALARIRTVENIIYADVGADTSPSQKAAAASKPGTNAKPKKG